MVNKLLQDVSYMGNLKILLKFQDKSKIFDWVELAPNVECT